MSAASALGAADDEGAELAGEELAAELTAELELGLGLGLELELEPELEPELELESAGALPEVPTQKEGRPVEPAELEEPLLLLSF